MLSIRRFARVDEPISSTGVSQYRLDSWSCRVDHQVVRLWVAVQGENEAKAVPLKDETSTRLFAEGRRLA